MDKLIKNGIIVNADATVSGDVLIQNGIVARIGDDIEHSGADVIDAKGKFVMPGGVDVHTHFNLDLGNIKAQDDFYSGTVAAACGGTTCIVDYPGFGPKGCDLYHQIEQYRFEAKGQAVIDYGLHGIFQHVNQEIIDEIQSLVDAGIYSFKGYLTYAGKLDDQALLRALSQVKKVGGLFTVHAENDAIIEFLRDRFLAQEKKSPHYHALSRPARCEAEAVGRMIHLAAIAGNAPLYVVHLSSALGLAAVKTAQAVGQPVFAETCPQYLLLNEDRYDEPDLGGLKYIMSPPLRKKADNAALWQGIREGHIEVVATDHCPFDFTKKKALGGRDFSRCPGGVPGVELRIPLIFSEGVGKKRISLTRFVDITATSPARIMGLYPKKGIIAPGSDADIILMDPNRSRTVTHKMLHENVDYTPYEGFTVQGWPMLTMVRGHVVAKDGNFVGEKGFGKFVKRKIA
jgi:dihydropyrimidinase